MRSVFLPFSGAFYICCACLIGCSGTGTNFRKTKLLLPEEAIAYTMYGPIHNYELAMTKPKVITYCKGVGNFGQLLSETPYLKINKLILQNPEIEFVFFIDGVKKEETDRLLSVLNQYHVTYPVILDYDSLFAKENSHRIGGEGLKGVTLFGLFCDQTNRLFDGGGVIGTDKSKMFFEPNFAKFKASLK